MSNQTNRDELYTKNLRDFICEEYHLKEISLTPAQRGFYGETWKATSHSNAYFVKLIYFPEYQDIYERSFEVIDFLCSKGIDFINTIVKTVNGNLFTHFDGAVLGLFDWIDGENIETNETKLWEYQLLAKVYTVPVNEVNIRKEDFSGKSADIFFKQWKQTEDQEILSFLEKNQEKLKYRARRLKYFSDLCREDTSDFYITHGDAGGNFFVNGDKHFLVDWDDVLFAPPERDAWVMGFCDWARCLFQKSLHQQGIQYVLRPERLAYYCYYMFFFWLTWLIKCSTLKEIEDFFEGYDEERIEYADKLWKESKLLSIS